MLGLFFKRLSSFTLVAALTHLIVGKLFIVSFNDLLYSKKTFELDPSIKAIFLGDSHAKCAFNDEVVAKSFNASRNSESYFQTYQKLKILLDSNPNIKTVILSYSPHNIAKSYEGIILYGKKYFPLLDKESKNIIKNANLNGLIEINARDSLNLKDVIKKIKHNLSYYFLRLKYDWGLPENINKYEDYLLSCAVGEKDIALHPLFSKPYKSTKSNLRDSTIKKAINRHFYYRNSGEVLSPIMIRYLHKMIELNTTRGVTTILVNTPLHNSYYNQIPSFYLEEQNRLTKTLKSTYGDKLIYLDSMNDKFAEKHYGDGDHLNYYGNQIFSQKLDCLIQRRHEKYE